MKLGIISDTHDLLRPQVFELFDRVDHILHAGDVGDPEILVELRALAPVTAVWGNTDGWRLRRDLPEIARVEVAGLRCLVIHGQQLGSPTPQALAERHPDTDLIAFGHTHRPVIRRVGEVLTINPGSAGPVRFGAPPTVAIASITEEGVQAELMRIALPTDAAR
jgi:uncharacterized protein